jgi:hypothetical protein
MTTNTVPTVFGLILHPLTVERAILVLRDGGFPAESISILYPYNDNGGKDVVTINSTKAPEGALTGAAGLGLLGAVGGFLVGVGALAIPGAGPFLAAGPIMTALSSAAVAATVGGLAGGLIGLGVPEYEAKAYDANLRQGKTLIAVHCVDAASARRAREVLTKVGATDISTTNTSYSPAAVTPDNQTTKNQ